VSRMLRLLRGNTGDLHHRRCRERDCANGDTSELVVLLTPITFEGYCSELKKAVDRVIPLILPYFLFVRHEVHHIRRCAVP